MLTKEIIRNQAKQDYKELIQKLKEKPLREMTIIKKTNIIFKGEIKMEVFDLINREQRDEMIKEMYQLLKKHNVTFICPVCNENNYEENMGSLLDGHQQVKCKCGWVGRKMDMAFDKESLKS